MNWIKTYAQNLADTHGLSYSLLLFCGQSAAAMGKSNAEIRDRMIDYCRSKH